MTYILLGVTILLVLWVAFLRSPFCTWSREQFDKDIKVNTDPNYPYWGGYWTQAGAVAQGEWWGKVLTAAGVVLLFVLLVVMGVTHRM